MLRIGEAVNPRETARKLIALATNSSASPEEARTAAMRAARIIREHKLLDEGEGFFAGAKPATPPPGYYSNRPGPFDPFEMRDFIARAAAEHLQRMRREQEAEEVRRRERSPAIDPDWDPLRTADERERMAYGEGWDRIWGRPAK